MSQANYRDREWCIGQCMGLGKFELEGPSTVYFYEMMMLGEGEESYTLGNDGSSVTVFKVTRDDPQWVKNEHPEHTYFVLEITGQGFVFGAWISTEELPKYRQRWAAMQEEDGDE